MFFEVQEIIESGTPVYIVKLNAVNVEPEGNTNTVPELEQLLQEFTDVLSGLPEGLPPSRARDYHIRMEPGTTPPASRVHLLSGVQLAELRAQLQELLERGLFAHRHHPTVHPFYLSQRRWWLEVMYCLQSVKSLLGTSTLYPE